VSQAGAIRSETELESGSESQCLTESDLETTCQVVLSASLCDSSVGSMGIDSDLMWQGEGLRLVPYVRWDLEAISTGSAALVRFAGFMQDVDMWDSQMFGISQNEGMQTDSQQRMLMSNAFSVLKHGGETTSAVKGSNRAVVVGIASTEYTELFSRVGAPITSYVSLGGSISVSCGRISYTFGFTGPSYSIDTACSSSVVSAHIAVRSLQSGESQSGMSAGVQHILIPEVFAVLVSSNMLAKDGRCKTLDSTADGYVRAEACGTFVLKPLPSSANSIVLLMSASSVNQDGRSSSLTAPNGPSQQSVVNSSLEQCVLKLEQYIQHEMHGRHPPWRSH
jgi:acyl transferase domain-containing protein